MSPALPLMIVMGAALLVVVLWAAAGRHLWIVLVVVVLVFTTSSTSLRASTVKTAAPAQLAKEGAAATARVTLVGEPHIRLGRSPPLAVARAELRELQARGSLIVTRQPVVIFASGPLSEQFAAADSGGVYEVHGLLAPAEDASPESLVIRARSLSEQQSPPGPVDELVNSLRAGLRDSTVLSRPLQAALVPSLVVGDTAGITEEMDEQFKATSLSHLMAVSGSNLSLMLVVLLALTRAVGIRGWWVRIVGLCGVALFVLVCRGEPSVVRAAAMGLVAVSAVGVGKGRRSVRNLALAVMILMLIDPWLSRSWGFSLSVAACSGIALWSPAWVEAISAWAPRWLAEALAIPLAAQMATQPLITALSGRVSVIGVVANAFAGPFVGPATVLGLAAMCTAFLPVLPLLLGWVAGWCVQPILWIAQVGSALPSATLEWPATALGIGLSALCVVVLGSLLIHALRRRITTLLLVLCLMAGSLFRPVVWGWPGDWQAVFCDVGQGDATVLNAGGGRAVLVDTGPDEDGIVECLSSLRIQAVPVVVLTHFHADHTAGLASVLERYSPEMIVVSSFASPAEGAALVRRRAEASSVALVTAQPGDVWEVGNVSWNTISVLAPDVVVDNGVGESSVENDSSVVGVAEVDGLRLMLPGDTEPWGQRRALAEADHRDLNLKAHILKLPHHGSARQESAFFTATEAKLAVASVGLDNDYGHPAQTALDLAARSGMTVARTDLDGSIAVGLVKGQLTVRRTK
ncbi:MAG: ComEC/Rec2 family competence protein [Arachnia sp.]